MSLKNKEWESKFKAFTTTSVGSMPRSDRLLELKASLSNGELNQEYNDLLEEETKNVVAIQDNSNIDLLVTGELARDNFVSYVAEKIDGVKLMSMHEIFEVTKNRDEFDESLKNMDASDNSMSNPICFSKIVTDKRLNKDEVELIKVLTNKPIKISVPSPYILTRSMWLDEITKEYYHDREALGEDVVKLITHEVKALIDEGVDVIQLDEPILSEVVFAGDKGENSFY